MSFEKDKTERDSRTFAIIGAAMEVHAILGCGFIESVYHEALALELDVRAIPFRREVQLEVFYKSRRLPNGFRVDFLCYDRVVVELKALSRLTTTDEAQIINYLKATDCEVGLLINFGTLSLEYRRFVRSRPSDKPGVSTDAT